MLRLLLQFTAQGGTRGHDGDLEVHIRQPLLEDLVAGVAVVVAHLRNVNANTQRLPGRPWLATLSVLTLSFLRTGSVSPPITTVVKITTVYHANRLHEYWRAKVGWGEGLILQVV